MRMHWVIVLAFVVSVVLLTVISPSGSTPATAQGTSPTTRVSVASDDTQGTQVGSHSLPHARDTVIMAGSPTREPKLRSDANLKTRIKLTVTPNANAAPGFGNRPQFQQTGVFDKVEIEVSREIK